MSQQLWLPGCGCECGQCEICLDTFNRSHVDDAADVGACFTTFGDLTAEIVSNALRISGTECGLLFVADSPESSSSFLLGTWPFEINGDRIQLKLLFAWQDANNHCYWLLDHRMIGVNVYTFVTLYRVEGGTATLLRDKLVDGFDTSVNAFPLGGQWNNFSIYNGSITWHYNAENGWCHLMFGESLNPSLVQQSLAGMKECSWHRFLSDVPPAGKMGIAFGEHNNRYFNLDQIKLQDGSYYDPVDSLGEGCDNTTIYPFCRTPKYPPEEFEVTLASFTGAYAGLNGTYVVQLEHDHTYYAPYRRSNTASGVRTRYGGLLYKYTFPTAVGTQQVKEIHFWLHDQFHQAQGGGTVASIGYLVTATGAQALFWLASHSTPDCPTYTFTSTPGAGNVTSLLLGGAASACSIRVEGQG